MTTVLDNLPHARPWSTVGTAEPLRRIRAEGRYFVTEAGTVRPVFASLLTALTKTPDERRARLAELREIGFEGIRVFAGGLSWADQTPARARAELPALLAEAREAGLAVLVTALTDTAHYHFDLAAHVREIAALCATHDHTLLEIANEFTHPTQREAVQDPERLADLARSTVPPGVMWALGAPDYDEPQNGDWPIPSGPFITAHLDRGRDKWNQARRVRELYAIKEVTGKPVFNSEPIGADEQMGGATGNRQRRNDPEFFFALGALNRGFELGGVFHSQAGLMTEPLGPVQRRCAEAFLAGFRALPTEARLEYKNARWHDSPVVDADFGRVTRAYSFVFGDEGYTVLVGIQTGGADVRYGNGWRAAETIAESSIDPETQTLVRVIKIGRQ